MRQPSLRILFSAAKDDRLLDNDNSEFGDAFRQLHQFEKMREEIEWIDERLISELTRDVWASAARLGWKFGFEYEPVLRWWFAPLDWRRTFETPNCQYDFDIFFYLIQNGNPCEDHQWPVGSFSSYLADIDDRTLVIRCHAYRLLTKSFVSLMVQRPDLLGPLLEAGWVFNASTAYLEFPLQFDPKLLALEINAGLIDSAFSPIRTAMERISIQKQALFDPIHKAASAILAKAQL